MSHNYDTIYVEVYTLDRDSVLVGIFGGLSVVYSILGEHPMLGVIVETEHGIMCFASDSYVEVLK